MSPTDLSAFNLSLSLAGTTTCLLLLIGTPLAWWLARSQCAIKSIVEAVFTLPLVLPPTVLGFYLLLAFTGTPFLFSFKGLVVGSCIYSLPFVIQPLQVAFSSIDKSVLEMARSMSGSAWHRFWSIIFPLTRRGFLCAGILSFAHTLGEFGVVLMIGGNIPGKTELLSITIFNHVEALQYHDANVLSLSLLAFSFVVLVTLTSFNTRYTRRIL